MKFFDGAYVDGKFIPAEEDGSIKLFKLDKDTVITQDFIFNLLNKRVSFVKTDIAEDFTITMNVRQAMK